MPFSVTTSAPPSGENETWAGPVPLPLSGRAEPGMAVEVALAVDAEAGDVAGAAVIEGVGEVAVDGDADRMVAAGRDAVRPGEGAIRPDTERCDGVAPALTASRMCPLRLRTTEPSEPSPAATAKAAGRIGRRAGSARRGCSARRR